MKIKQGKVVKKQIKKNEHSIYELLPYKSQQLDNEEIIIVDKNGKCQAFLEVSPQALSGLNRQEQFALMQQFEGLERVYNADHSIISLMFPPHVEENIEYLTKQLNRWRAEGKMNKVRHVQKQLQKVRYVHKNQPAQQYYIVVYGDSPKEASENRRLIKQLGAEALGLHDVASDDLEKLIFKLNNMNTLI